MRSVFVNEFLALFSPASNGSVLHKHYAHDHRAPTPELSSSIIVLLVCDCFIGILDFGSLYRLSLFYLYPCWYIATLEFRCHVIPYETSWPNDLSGKGRHRAWKWVSPVPDFPEKPWKLAFHSAEESDAFPVLFWSSCTAAGSYIALNDVQTTSTEYGHDTPLIVEISVNWLLTLSQSSTVHIWNFFAQLCRLAFISFVSFFFLLGWQACIQTVSRHQRTVYALTPPPKWPVLSRVGC